MSREKFADGGFSLQSSIGRAFHRYFDFMMGLLKREDSAIPRIVVPPGNWVEGDNSIIHAERAGVFLNQ